MTEHHVWINHKQYNNWVENTPFWIGSANHEEEAAELATSMYIDWAFHNGEFDPKEPLLARVYQPFTKAPRRYFNVHLTMRLSASEIKEPDNGATQECSD